MTLRLALALAAVLACACARDEMTRMTTERWEARGRECARRFPGDDDLDRASAPEDVPHPHPSLAALPPEARRTAKAAGIEALVARALELGRSRDGVNLELVAVRQDLNLRVLSLESQLAAMIFEVECTDDAIEAIASELEARASKRELILALTSLVLGASAATAAGIWELADDDSRGPAITGMTGGIASAALGGAAFVPYTVSATYWHPHNLLAPIARGDDPQQLYPRFVFRLLSLPMPDGTPPPREQLLTQWQRLLYEAVPKDERAAAAELLYGKGGRYDQHTIGARESMVDALEIALHAQARDLELLDRSLVRALGRAVASP